MEVIYNGGMGAILGKNTEQLVWGSFEPPHDPTPHDPTPHLLLSMLFGVERV